MRKNFCIVSVPLRRGVSLGKISAEVPHPKEGGFH
jgi:hypothetical protein